MWLGESGAARAAKQGRRGERARPVPVRTPPTHSHGTERSQARRRAHWPARAQPPARGSAPKTTQSAPQRGDLNIIYRHNQRSQRHTKTQPETSTPHTDTTRDLNAAHRHNWRPQRHTPTQPETSTSHTNTTRDLNTPHRHNPRPHPAHRTTHTPAICPSEAPKIDRRLRRRAGRKPSGERAGRGAAARRSDTDSHHVK